jgi:hypothetical protein
MNWYWISIGAVGGIVYLLAKGRRTEKGGAPVERSATERDRVDAVLASEDTEAMMSVLEKTQDPLLRDALFSPIIVHHYRRRSDPENRKRFYALAGQHVAESATVLEALAQTDAGRPDRMDTFRMMAIALAEDERYDEAIDLCRQALSLGLENGTKTGFEGRIGRLQKRRDAVS